MLKRLLETSLRSVFAPAKHLAKLLNEQIYFGRGFSGPCDLCLVLPWWQELTCVRGQIKLKSLPVKSHQSAVPQNNFNLFKLVVIQNLILFI